MRPRDWFFLLALVLVPSSAMAQTNKAELARNRDAARVLAEKGLDLVDAKKYAEAIAMFEQAEAKFHAPTHLLFIARAYAEMGKLVESAKAYRRVIDEALPGYAPDAFHEAQGEAKKELEALKRRIPRLGVTIHAEGAGTASVQLDGEPIDWQSGSVEANAGEHEVTASLGQDRQTRKVKLEEGRTLDIEITLSASGDKPPEEKKSGGSLVPTFIAFGVGGASLIAGAVTGGLSLSKVGELETMCPDKQCGPGAMPTADAARTLGTISTVSFIVGGVGVAAGTVLLFVRPGKSERATGGFWTPILGPGYLGVTGRF